jgi:hypothetical protein
LSHRLNPLSAIRYVRQVQSALSRDVGLGHTKALCGA